MGDWLISLKTKIRPAPLYAAGFAYGGVTGRARREEGLDTKTQGLLKVLPRGQGSGLALGRPLPVSARASSRRPEAFLPSPQPPIKVHGDAAATLLRSRPPALLRPARPGPSRPVWPAEPALLHSADTLAQLWAGSAGPHAGGAACQGTSCDVGENRT